MKIQRVIRFKKLQNTEDVKAEVKEVSTGIRFSASEEDVQPENGISHADFQSQEMEESGPSAFDQLKRDMETVLAGRGSNMIGVFGMNADNVIGQLKRDPIFHNVNFLGKIEPPPASDIYDYIAAILLDYLNRTTVGRHDLDYERREALRTIETIYASNKPACIDVPLEVLHRTSLKAKRDSYILTALNQISRINNYRSSSIDREDKFLLIVELEGVDYVMLKKLLNLQSSELIIIVYSLLNLEYVVDSETTRAMGGESNIIGKFFPAGNYIMAN